MRDIFEEYIGRGVITSEFISQTGYPVWSLSNEIKADNSTIVVLPTSIPESCQTSGIWYYYSNSDEKRIHYEEKANFSNRIENEIDISAYPVNTSFTAASFVQLQSQLCDVLLDDLNTVYVETRGGDEEEDGPPCIGGEYVDVQVWVYDPSSSGTNLQHINTLLNEIEALQAANSEVFGFIGGYGINGSLDGASYSELIDKINGFLEWNFDYEIYRPVLEAYAELRQGLSLLGIGNGSTGILDDARNRGGEKFWTSETIKIWVWCWDDPLDFDLSSGQGTGGGSTSVVPDYWPDMQELQDCIAVNDVHDVDTQSGGNADASFTGDIVMCTLWNAYLADCLSGDFEGVSASSYFTPYQHNSSPYATWGQFKHDYPDLFNEIINNEHGCITTAQTGGDINTTDNDDPFVDCGTAAVINFVNTYNLELTKEEELLLYAIGCVDNFDILAGEALLSNHFNIEINDVKIIGGYIFGKDENGILKIYLPIDPDPSELTSQELFDKIILVLNCVTLYYCETLVYEPIDWKDYFHNVSGGSYVINWDDNVTFGPCPVTMLLDFTWGGNVMNTSYSLSTQTSDDPPINVWKWNGVNTDAALLQIATKSSNGCKDILYDFFNPECN